MKQLILLFLLTLSLFAKKDDYLYEAAFLLGNSENGLTQNLERSPAYQLQYQYNGFDFPIKPELSFVYSQNIPIYTGGETRYATIMGNGVYEIPYSELITPYLKAGVGYTYFADEPGSPASSPTLDAGAGLKMHIRENIALKFQVMFLQESDRSNLLATGGISYAFGKKDVKAAPAAVKEPEPVKEAKVVEEPKAIKEIVPVVIVKKDPEPIIIVKKDLPSLYLGFASGKSKLTDESKSSIKNYAQEINSNGNQQKHLFITGHTDDQGTRAFNATLSIKRANAARAEFIANNVDPKRITVDAMGEIAPAATNETGKGREKNRRVIIIVDNENNNSN
ncbi:MAG: OmpA family protein [Sulfurimonadaceae bacterium]